MNIFSNKNGTANLGLITSILVIIFLIVGSFYFFNFGHDIQNDLKGENVVDTFKKAENEIENINKITEERNEVISKSDEEISTENEFIKIFNIKENNTVSSPLKIEGEGIAFENTLIVELRDQNHKAKVKEFVTTKAADAGESGPFSITLYFEFSNTKEGYVAVYEESAKDGSELNLVEIPVKFESID